MSKKNAPAMKLATERRKERFAKLIWQGKTAEEAAATVGWSASTGRNYLRHPTVNAIIRRLDAAADIGALEGAKELGKREIMSLENAQILLSQLANNPEIEPRERINATDRLAKMKGWYAAQKVQIVPPEGIIAEFTALGVELPPVLAEILREQATQETLAAAPEALALPETVEEPQEEEQRHDGE